MYPLLMYFDTKAINYKLQGKE